MTVKFDKRNPYWLFYSLNSNEIIISLFLGKRNYSTEKPNPFNHNDNNFSEIKKMLLLR